MARTNQAVWKKKSEQTDHIDSISFEQNLVDESENMERDDTEEDLNDQDSSKEIDKTQCPNQCKSLNYIPRLNKFSPCPEESDNPHLPPMNPGTKINVSEKESFQSFTKTAKQPRKENNFTLLISNPFDVLAIETDENQGIPSKQEKEGKILP
ncbi:hypothetical protein NPIL_14281 [Nephila pilipes]|uniref:Uncharacterized protein n=1 Tax=Nephila pilipes TaxID=299642 RepID=A0A8X6QM70_NEPPI|nr:hypothetical protein NPIL_14281 [Nephila pilipes]